jgi:CBS domain-containing protein
MKIRDVMTSDVETCHPDTDLATVVRMMWDRDCGFIPVIDATGLLRGVVTDRDICIASATRRVLPEYMSAHQAMTHPVHACVPDDEVADALRAMKQYKVRRMPVIDSNGAVKGVISMNDIVLASQQGLGPDAKDIVATLAAICVHRTLTPEAPPAPGKPAVV